MQNITQTPYTGCAMNILSAYACGPHEAQAVMEYLVAKLESLGVPFVETIGPFFPQPYQQSYPVYPMESHHAPQPQLQPEQEIYSEKRTSRSKWGQKQKSPKSNMKNKIVKRVNFEELRRSEEPVNEQTSIGSNSPPISPVKSDKPSRGKVDWNALGRAKDDESYIVVVNEVEGLIQGKIAEIIA